MSVIEMETIFLLEHSIMEFLDSLILVSVSVVLCLLCGHRSDLRTTGVHVGRSPGRGGGGVDRLVA